MKDFFQNIIIASYGSISQKDDKVKMNKVIQKIKSFGDLQMGWDFGEGYPANQEVINKSISILIFGSLCGFNYDARPATNGGIILNFFIADNFIYVQINPNNTYDLRYEKGIGENYEILADNENMPLQEILKTLTNIKELWFLSGLYTSTNMMKTVEDFPATASRTMEKESQYSWKTVHRLPAEPFVITYPHTIQEPQEFQLSFAE